jgi:uncharacterized protein YggE
MRTFSGFIAPVLLSLLLLAGCGLKEQENRLITVTGDAEVRVPPDEVILTFGIETWDKNLATAKRQNDARTSKVLALSKRFKIEPKHVQTDHISIDPSYESYYDHSAISGYTVRKTVVFILRDTNKFEDLLGAALEAGANYVHGVEFRTTEMRKHRDEARALAIRAAREKAIELAQELGQSVGEPQSINEEYSNWWYWYNSWWGSRWSGGMAQNVIQNVGGEYSEADGSIALGQIKVNARVRVSFALK